MSHTDQVYRAIRSDRWTTVPAISARTGIVRRQVRAIVNKLLDRGLVQVNQDWTLPVHDDPPKWRRIPVDQIGQDLPKIVRVL